METNEKVEPEAGQVWNCSGAHWRLTTRYEILGRWACVCVKAFAGSRVGDTSYMVDAGFGRDWQLVSPAPAPAEVKPGEGRFPPQKGDVWRWPGIGDYVFTGEEVKQSTCSYRLWAHGDGSMGFADDAFGRILTFVRYATTPPTVEAPRPATCGKVLSICGGKHPCGLLAGHGGDCVPYGSTSTPTENAKTSGHGGACLCAACTLHGSSAVLERGPGIAAKVLPPPRPAPWVPSVTDEDCLGVDVDVRVWRGR